MTDILGSILSRFAGVLRMRQGQIVQEPIKSAQVGHEIGLKIATLPGSFKPMNHHLRTFGEGLSETGAMID